MSDLLIRKVLAAKGFPPREKLVLAALASHCNQKQGDMRCWPSKAVLSEMTGYSLETVRRSLRALRSVGLSTQHRGRWWVYDLRGVRLQGSETRTSLRPPTLLLFDPPTYTDLTPPHDEPEKEPEKEPENKASTSAARENRGKSRASKPKKPRSPKLAPLAEISGPPEPEYKSAPRKRKPDLYGLPAQELATHLHDEYRRVYDQEQDPLTEAFGTSIGHAKRLLRLKYPTGPPAKLNGEKGVLTWWLEHTNEGREGTEFELHDFSMQRFVAKFTGISNRMEAWADAKKAKRRVR